MLKVKVSSYTINEALQNHPDWPTLLSVSDCLSKWNIPNAAAKIEVADIDELPTPFIACTRDRENPLAVVNKVSQTEIETYHENYSKPTIYSRAEFLKNWDGVYLIAEPNSYSGEANFASNRRKAFFNRLIPSASIACLIFFSFYLLNRVTGASSLPVIAVYLQYFILLAGVVVTSLLLWYEIDKTNPMLQKVCTGIAKGDCNAILTGKHSKVFSWLSWSEVGFFYFSGSLLLLVFADSNIGGAVNIISWLNILALPYTVFSVYFQWRVAKQWCVLCLVVQALLLCGALNIISNGLPTSLAGLPFHFVIKALFLSVLPVLCWFVVRPAILKLQEAKNTKRAYLRIKFNSQIFDTLLRKQKGVSVSADGLGINLGNPNAANTLIKICNPYCGPCAKAHAKIENLLEGINNLKVQIIFTSPNKPDHPAYEPVNHLLAIQEKNRDEQTLKHALDEWYLSDHKDYAAFAAKYPLNGELTTQGHKIEAMDNWCKAMDVQATPTIFINGYQLPDAYDVEDLQYFLLE